METENVLRPTAFDSFIGQQKIVRQLKTHVLAEKLRKERGDASYLDHMVFEGNAGLGKTSLAFVIGKELEAKVKVMQGVSIEHQGQLVANILSLEEGDIFFIDEIHALSKSLQDALLTIMEDFRLDITPPDADPISITLPRFTLIGATTEIGTLQTPLKDRFIHKFKLLRYTVDELTEILVRSCNLLLTTYDDEALKFIAGASRGTPRIANNILKKVRNYADVYNNNHISLSIAKDALNDASIEESGLEESDRQYINALLEAKKPLGIKTISGMLAIDIKTIENDIESFLLFHGLIEKNPKGRILSEKGMRVAKGELNL
ncbi:Holliday junction branch migration DNA helicase RuvB [Vibrio sp. D431a]|uniref:Holliday junction branch migration DNA helicase RuvB n=1 Tax=Vibrio sp. D431a TaxID=2837388 RepID=UPI0025561DD4|nr:Holliday junction branch migration DNA helicase RuvB [Vibrio sp. D431a]MDK9793857.1 Holliday junction branch migration DNA helicase RuvB [Vibrio sp. D431a]